MRAATILSLLVLISLVAVHQLVRLQHEAAYWNLVLLQPPPPNGGMTVAMATERTITTLFVWGTTLTLVVLVSGITVWRATRSRALHPIFIWCSRLAVAVALAGAVWHASVANWYAQTFDEIFTRAAAASSRPR